MALYRNHVENTPLLGRIKLGTTELSNGAGAYLYALVSFTGSWSGLGTKIAQIWKQERG